MGRSSKVQSEATARQIRDVAVELFASDGYAGVGLDEIAARSKVTRGAVYHHFGSKSGLFSAALECVQERVAERVARAAESADSAWAGLVLGCHAFLDAGSDPQIHRIMLVDGPAVLGWREWRQLDAANSRRLLENGLVELEDDGILAAGVARAATPLLSGAMNEAVLWIADSAHPVRDTSAARAALDRLLDSLRA